MAHYADQIANLPLLNHLRRSAGRDDISKAEVEQLVAMVLGAAETIGPLLKQIPQTFRQYTEHDIQHSRNLIDLMGRFIPVKTLKRLNAVELTILALSALLHDSGMYVSDAEKTAALVSDGYRRFEAGQGERAALLAKARAAGEHLRAATLQDALLAEYFRRLHPERAADVVRKHLAGKLEFRGTDLTPAVLRVCESHGWGVLESNDPRNPEKAVARLATNRPLPGVPVNEQYLACCLRLADIMDFDRSRTPVSVFQHLAFTEEKSWEEWNKHLQVKGWHVDEHEVRYAAPCTHPAFYVAVMEFLDWIDAELRDCRVLVREAPKPVAERYELNLPPVVDRRQVEMEDRSYLAGAFRFQLDYERIMQLLMDKSLYPDPSLFLRELLQNALDACRTREAHAKAAGAPYEARIAVWDYSDNSKDPRIVFQDNGMGMSRRIVENYFMRVGRSYYKSPEFDVERQRLAEAGVELEATSQFGIGILSCFMVADRFKVETYRVGSQPLHIEIEGPTKYSTIQQLPEPERTDFPARPVSDAEEGPPRFPGTRITVHLRPDIEIDVLKVLDLFAVNVEYETRIYRGSSGEVNVITTRRWRNEELKPSALDKFGRDMRIHTDEQGVTKVLDSLLVPVRVPLDQYEFASHLDGQAWVWLLRGEAGEARLSSGYLEIGRYLSCSGAASFVGEVNQLYRARRSNLKITRSDLIARIADGIATLTNPFDGLDSPYFSHAWSNFSSDEQLAILRSLKNDTRNSIPWYADKVAAEALLRGGMEWADREVDLAREFSFFHSTEALALYGIRLPAGIVSWDPMTGTAEREEFFLGRGGFAVDVRGGGIRPAASRLFVDATNAQMVVTPLLRSFTRLGVSLLNSSGQGDLLEWRSWFEQTILPSIDGSDVWRLEFDAIEQSVRYLCTINSALILGYSPEISIGGHRTKEPMSHLLEPR
ncbi:MAG TPA: hypothetical protein VF746_16050 [Longimicrobium sp.]|jgi:hypothetical protein